MTNNVKDLIKKDTVVMFSKTNNSYCKKVKDIFRSMNVSLMAIELDLRTDGKEMHSTLEQITGVRTLPRIFIKGQCIGGENELQNLLDEGKLKPMLKT